MTENKSTAEAGPIKGRGAQSNVKNRFHEHNYAYDRELEDIPFNESRRTEYIGVHPKTAVNKVDSPDVGMDFSLNPYQGCEHGCVYCYARNTHAYWGYNAGLDFEQKIMIKRNVPQLLEKTISKPSWKARPIVLSGNTDCYQPVEKKEELTRQCLEVFLKYRHPVGIITKNALVLRDMDLLTELRKHNLVRVVLSITTLNEQLRRTLEPRTASVLARLRTLEKLAQNDIPVSVMMAPIIPGLNDTEIMQLAENTAKLGSRGLGYTLLRLNGDVEQIFIEWIDAQYPNKAARVKQLIKSTRGGKYGESRFGHRMRGEGPYAEHIRKMFDLARRKYYNGRGVEALNCDLHRQIVDPQMRLF